MRRSGHTTRIIEKAAGLASDGQRVHLYLRTTRDIRRMKVALEKFLDERPSMSGAPAMPHPPRRGYIAFRLYNEERMCTRPNIAIMDGVAWELPDNPGLLRRLFDANSKGPSE